ncbi:MAG TPA: hypothetical protein VGA01_04695 [Candidatus Binatia bacterium]
MSEPKNEGNWFAQIVQAFASRANRIFVRSAANPSLWLCVAVAPPFLFAAYWLREHPGISYPLAFVAILVVLAAVYTNIFLLHTDPAKLQTETFQLEQQRLYIQYLQGIQAPGVNRFIDIRATPIIPNPAEELAGTARELAAAAAEEGGS